jgi:hypothetical protein
MGAPPLFGKPTIRARNVDVNQVAVVAPAIPPDAKVAVRVLVFAGVDVGPPGNVVAVRVLVFAGVDVGAPGIVVAVRVLVFAGNAVCVDVGLAGIMVAVDVFGIVGVPVGAKAQNTGTMALVSSVTAPVRATALPSRLAPEFMVMLATAKIFPMS